MIDSLLLASTFVAALGCALVAGVFFAFSSFVMRALGRLRPEQGIAAMQSINVVVINPGFMTAFLGTSAVCAMVLILALLHRHGGAMAFLVVGSVLYLAGTLLVTMLANVPRNDALAAVDPGSAAAAPLWSSYLDRWTAWNHVRTAAAFGAATSFTIVLCL